MRNIQPARLAVHYVKVMSDFSASHFTSFIITIAGFWPGLFNI